MHIIFPIEQLKQWAALGDKMAQVKALECCRKLGLEVEIHDDGSFTPNQPIETYSDQHKALHMIWRDSDDTVVIGLSPEQVEEMKGLSEKLTEDISGSDAPEKSFIDLGTSQCQICGSGKEDEHYACQECMEKDGWHQDSDGKWNNVKRKRFGRALPFHLP